MNREFVRVAPGTLTPTPAYRRAKRQQWIIALLILAAASAAALAAHEDFAGLRAPLVAFGRTTLAILGIGTGRMASATPAASTAYFGIAIFSAVPFFLLIWRWMRRLDGKVAGLLFTPRERYTLWKRLLTVLAVLFFFAILIGAWLGFEGASSRLFKFGDSLLGLLVFGWGYPWALGALAAIVLGGTKKALTGSI